MIYNAYNVWIEDTDLRREINRENVNGWKKM
jgi:hypothetical protein